MWSRAETVCAPTWREPWAVQNHQRERARRRRQSQRLAQCQALGTSVKSLSDLKGENMPGIESKSRA